MIVGVPTEIKPGEHRVAITPSAVETLVSKEQSVRIQAGAGIGSGISDAEYAAAGAECAPDAETVYRTADLVLKVKEIFPREFNFLKQGQIIFSYLHSAGNPAETQALLDKKVVAIAYEDIRTADGRFPLLTPMSEIAGEVGFLMGVSHMFTMNGGGGVLIGGAVGAAPARVAVLGAGNVGLGAVRCAVGLGGDVTLLDIDLERLRDVRRRIFPGLKTRYMNAYNVRQLLPETDLLINAVKWPPTAKGHIVDRGMLGRMKPQALIVDIACDPGGAIETCRPTTLAEPTYIEGGVRHLCVDNLPSAVAHTASQALSNATLPYVLEIAENGWLEAVKRNAALRSGLGFALGYLTFAPTAAVQNRPLTPVEDIIRMFA